MSFLSRGRYAAKEMVGIEGVMLQALGWRTCRANKANFVGAALEALLPGGPIAAATAILTTTIPVILLMEDICGCRIKNTSRQYQGGCNERVKKFVQNYEREIHEELCARNEYRGSNVINDRKSVKTVH